MSHFNPLLVFTQPRDIPQFIDQMFKYDRSKQYDRLFIKYTPAHTAYHIARSVFLDHIEYSHYIYGTDDLIYQDRDLELLINRYQTLTAADGHDRVVLAADMNLDMENPELRGFITAEHPIPPLRQGHNLVYEDYHFANQQSDAELVNPPTNHMLKCCWSALPLAILSRYVVQKTTFNNDAQYISARSNTMMNTMFGCCIDVVFAHECRDNDISIYTDLEVKTIHLKPSVKDNRWLAEYNQVGKKHPEAFILEAKTNQKRIPFIKGRERGGDDLSDLI